MRKSSLKREFAGAVYYWQLESAVSRGSAGSEWGSQILKYADDFKKAPSHWLPPWPETEFQTWKIHISLFLADATSRISLKAKSHAGAEERFSGGGVQTSEPFTGRLAAMGETETRRREESVCASVWVRKRKNTTPTKWKRAIIE